MTDSEVSRIARAKSGTYRAKRRFTVVGIILKEGTIRGKLVNVFYGKDQKDAESEFIAAYGLSAYAVAIFEGEVRNVR